ncbi:hypothetical protein [Photorhabdus bodei]|uniref:hypothetical protein n=1 Tax=Photorhabdus bodei TaxID=2029681 RepID=UPI0039829BC1
MTDPDTTTVTADIQTNNVVGTIILLEKAGIPVIFAKFLPPKLFEDIDPQADSLYLHKTFTSLDGNGVFWVTAK